MPAHTTNRLRRVALPLALVATMTLTAAACGGSKSTPTLSDPNATGRELVTEFVTILQNGDTAALQSFLDPGFQIQRADGTGADKDVYLQSPAKIASYTIMPGVEARQNGDVLTVRWAIEVDEVINGTSTIKGQAPRLSTFHWTGDRWQLSSHANFNLPS